MADYFEIDFLEVHTKKSGDAIGIRYGLNGLVYIHVVDGGYAATGDGLVQHINEYYGNPSFLDHVVVTHPDQDHAEGMQAVLEHFDVGALWMLLPWDYVDELIDRFARYTNPDNLKRKLREAYPYLVELEKIANRKGIPIYGPLQGARIGAFTVLSRRRRHPSRQRKTPCLPRSEEWSRMPRGLPRHSSVPHGARRISHQMGPATKTR